MVFIVLYKFRIKKVPILTIFSSEYLSLNIFSVIVNNISEYNITIIWWNLYTFAYEKGWWYKPSDKLGKDTATVSKWVINTTQPSLEALIAIANALEVLVQELVRQEEFNQEKNIDCRQTYLK